MQTAHRNYFTFTEFKSFIQRWFKTSYAVHVKLLLYIQKIISAGKQIDLNFSETLPLTE